MAGFNITSHVAMSCMRDSSWTRTGPDVWHKGDCWNLPSHAGDLLPGTGEFNLTWVARALNAWHQGRKRGVSPSNHGKEESTARVFSFLRHLW